MTWQQRHNIDRRDKWTAAWHHTCMAGGSRGSARFSRRRDCRRVKRVSCGGCSEKDVKLVQKLGQLQPFIAVLTPECMGQLASFGPT